MHRFIAASLLFVGFNGWTQEDSKATEATDQVEDRIVITGNRADQKLAETPRTIEAASREDARDAGATTLPELIQQLPGLSFQETNPGAGLPVLRGMVGPDNLALIDGMRFNTSTFRTGPNQYLATIGLSGLERLEVMQGSSSVLYGNGAMGGVVNAITLQPKTSRHRWHLQLLGRGLTASDFAVTLAPGANPDLMGTHRLSKRFHMVLGYHRRDVLERSGGSGSLEGQVVPSSGSSQQDWIIKASLKAGKNRFELGHLGMMIDGAARLDKLARGDIRQYDNGDLFTWLRWRRRSSGLVKRSDAWLAVHNTSEAVRRDQCLKDNGAVVNEETCVSGLGQDLSGSQALPGTSNFFDSSHLDRRRYYDDRVLAAQAGLNLKLKTLGPLRIQTGGELAHETVNSLAQEAKASDDFERKQKARGNFSDGSTWAEGGLYVHGRLRLANLHSAVGRRELELRGGTRVAFFGAQAPASGGLSEDVQYEHLGALGELQLVLLQPGKSAAWLGWSQGFRAPNLQESTVLGDTGSKFEIPNPELAPQRSDSFELASRRRFGRLYYGSSLWVSLVRGFIDEEPASYEGATDVNGSPVVKRVNADQALFFGGDLGLRIQVRPGLQFRNQFAYNHGDIYPDGEDAHPARRIPPLQGRHSLIKKFSGSKQRLELGLRWAMGQNRLHPSDLKDLRICAHPDQSHQTYKDQGEDCPGTPAWFVVDLGYARSLSKTVVSRLRISNLLDRNYKTHGSGTIAPGMTLALSLEGSY